MPSKESLSDFPNPKKDTMVKTDMYKNALIVYQNYNNLRDIQMNLLINWA